MTKVPPLRVRPGDIADMARYFVGQAARRKGLPQARLTEEAIKRLESYTFPNNIKVSTGSCLLACPQHLSCSGNFLGFQLGSNSAFELVAHRYGVHSAAY